MTKVLIIAEAGVNHNGDFEKAKELIKVAADAGADIVKFQTFKAEKLVSSSAKKAEYQKTNFSESDDSQFNMLKKLELPFEWHQDLIDYAKKLGVQFASTGFDEESIDFLEDLGQTFFKIPSGEITNLPYLEHIASKKKPTILSTGMADLQEITEAIEVLERAGLTKENITVLHCNTEYPTPMEDVNLNAMIQIMQVLNVKIGYSDHTLGIEVPIAATALGATVIEKHFTLDRKLPGPDHSASLEPDELKAMVQAIRNIEKAISGNGKKSPSQSESKNKIVARKSILLNKNLIAGSIITKEDLVIKRPGNGISPMKINEVIGKKLKNDMPVESILSWEDLI
ncbi:MAG: N-acetylneuraminate synthase [Flavobacteriales bacterium]|nr:N-acetylneuraminate synthase [Flavobacteriales bacterium]